MNTIAIQIVTAPVLALTIFGNPAVAQTGSSPILNALEVQKLVVGANPADNARLSAHFGALADRYAREAKRHSAMAQAFIDAPTRRKPAETAADHCKRLAILNARAAETLRELSAYHDRRAAGASATAPKGSAPFQAGAGAPEPPDDELGALAARASTPADHRALEAYFEAAAKRYREAVKEHLDMAQAYRGTHLAQAAVHCDRLVTLSRDEAKEAAAGAEVHKRLATGAR